MKNKARINITVDREALEKAKTKLTMFGGKLSTLFNAYLNDFVISIGKAPEGNYKEIVEKNKELESRLKKVEDAVKRKKN